jgi:hypothetical protein
MESKITIIKNAITKFISNNLKRKSAIVVIFKKFPKYSPYLSLKIKKAVASSKKREIPHINVILKNIFVLSILFFPF